MFQLFHLQRVPARLLRGSFGRNWQLAAPSLRRRADSLRQDLPSPSDVEMGIDNTPHAMIMWCFITNYYYIDHTYHISIIDLILSYIYHTYYILDWFYMCCWSIALHVFDRLPGKWNRRRTLWSRRCDPCHWKRCDNILNEETLTIKNS